MTISKVQITFGEVWMCGFKDMHADRQKHMQ